MPTQYSVTIQMEPATVQALIQNGFTLFGFQVVEATGRGYPVAWLATQQLAENVSIAWTDAYQAYTSSSTIAAGQRIVASSAYQITPGQTLTLNTPEGTGVVTQGGVPGAIAISNRTATQFATGTALGTGGGGANPACAFNLFGSTMEVIAPQQKVALVFSTQPGNAGTVFQLSYGPGVVIDLTGAATRVVKFDINHGFDAGGAAWAQTFPGDTDLVPLLINPSQRLVALKASLEDGANAS